MQFAKDKITKDLTDENLCAGFVDPETCGDSCASKSDDDILLDAHGVNSVMSSFSAKLQAIMAGMEVSQMFIADSDSSVPFCEQVNEAIVLAYAAGLTCLSIVPDHSQPLVDGKFVYDHTCAIVVPEGFELRAARGTIQLKATAAMTQMFSIGDGGTVDGFCLDANCLAQYGFRENYPKNVTIRNVDIINWKNGIVYTNGFDPGQQTINPIFENITITQPCMDNPLFGIRTSGALGRLPSIGGYMRNVLVEGTPSTGFPDDVNVGATADLVGLLNHHCFVGENVTIRHSGENGMSVVRGSRDQVWTNLKVECNDGQGAQFGTAAEGPVVNVTLINVVGNDNGKNVNSESGLFANLYFQFSDNINVVSGALTGAGIVGVLASGASNVTISEAVTMDSALAQGVINTGSENSIASYDGRSGIHLLWGAVTAALGVAGNNFQRWTGAVVREAMAGTLLTLSKWNQAALAVNRADSNGPVIRIQGAKGDAYGELGSIDIIGLSDTGVQGTNGVANIPTGCAITRTLLGSTRKTILASDLPSNPVALQAPVPTILSVVDSTGATVFVIKTGPGVFQRIALGTAV